MQGTTRIDELRKKFHENPRRYFAPLANEYRKAGDPEQAIAICRAHLAQQPGHMSGHVVYGQALYDAKRPEEARDVFEKALALDPDNAVVLKQLGDIAREKGDTSEARHWYSRAMEADPNDRETAAYFAELAEPVTEQAAAEERVEELEKIPPEQEVPVAEPAREPEVVSSSEPEPAPEAGEPGPPPVVPADEVAWRRTPMHEESPFVTRTMAELYASQGYHEAALDVYRQLALEHPDDKDISGRIEALENEGRGESGMTGPQAESAAPVEAPQGAETAEAPAEPPREAEPVPFEPIFTDLPSESAPDTFADVGDSSIFATSSEDLNLEIPAENPSSREPHFTENELSGGDAWDSDSWGAGFDSAEDVNLDFDSPDIPAGEPAAPEPVAQGVPEIASDTAPAEVNLSDPAAEDLAEEPVMEPQEESLAEEVRQPALEQAATPSGTQEEESPYEAEPEPADASHVVAYSPQLPEDEDLPHYAPQGPTVRDFFATLRAFKPSAKPGSSITAHAGIPAAPPGPDYPLASDAFGSLFSDSPVGEEDSRAAFALSGALGASEPTSPPIAAPQEPAPAEPASPAARQESEDDIRRFREWLDGLADT